MKIQQSKITEINNLHEELEAIVRSGLHKAIRIGQLLRECKDAIPHGQFSGWILNNCRFSVRTAQNYMKLYDNQGRIASADSIAMAYRLLKSETVSHLETQPPTFEQVQESMTRYIQAQVLDDIDHIAASDHAEKINFWMEYRSAALDDSSVEDVRTFQEQLTWIQDKFTESHLRAKTKLGELLADIQVGTAADFNF